RKADQVLAVDLIETNERINGHYKNVNFRCTDVMSPALNMSEGSDNNVQWTRLGSSFYRHNL
ncbi:hypothetical protein PanWU01x14_140420, partial [Parasponia andersonii]